MAEVRGARAEFSGRLLLKNTSLSFLGQALPILVAIVSIPQLIHRLGNDRFGVLMLAWMFLGYFNLFDFGLSRALTKSIAEKIDTDAEGEIPVQFWTVSISTALFGICGSLLMVAVSKWLAFDILKVPEGLEAETTNAFYVIAFALPFVITTACFRGVLEATQNFRIINRLQIPLGVLFYISPLLLSYFSISLPVVISALVVARAVGWLFYLIYALRHLPGKHEFKTNWTHLPALLKFGGWVTVANIPMPIIGYADRFIVGMLMSMTAVTYYSTPYEIVNKVTVIPAALLSVIFPAFASQLTTRPERTPLTYLRANKLLFIILFPVLITFVLMAPEGLSLWAGPDLSIHSFRILQILALAVFMNCFGVTPSALLDAMGLPKITAISHLIQLPIYIGALLVVIPRYGLEGAALIWVARNTIDTGTLYLFASRALPQIRVKNAEILLAMVPFAAIVAMAILFEPPLSVRVSVLVALALIFFPLVWLFVLSAADRKWVNRTLFAMFSPHRGVSFEKPVRNKVGIALASYKPKMDFFVRQLDSIRHQTFENWICVVSMDSDVELDDVRLAPFIGDERFIWLRNQGVSGVVGNFENAMSACIDRHVDMIAFSDQDDIWYPHKLQRLVAELRECRPMSLVHSDMHLFSSDSELDRSTALAKAWANEARVLEDYLPIHFFLRNTVTGASSLFDVELAKRSFPFPSIVEFHDHWLAIIAALYGEVRAVHEALYAYRQHGDNVVGFVRFEGVFYKPADMTWPQGTRKAALGWRKRRALYRALSERAKDDVELPSSYRLVFNSRVLGPVFFLLFSALYIVDDPALARAFLRNGMGGIWEPFQRREG